MRKWEPKVLRMIFRQCSTAFDQPCSLVCASWEQKVLYMMTIPRLLNDLLAQSSYDGKEVGGRRNETASQRLFYLGLPYQISGATSANLLDLLPGTLRARGG